MREEPRWPIEVGERQRQTALARYEIIRPLLKGKNPSELSVAEAAKKAGRTTRTLYRWIKPSRPLVPPPVRGLSRGPS